MKQSALKSTLLGMQKKVGPTQFSLTGSSQYSKPLTSTSRSHKKPAAPMIAPSKKGALHKELGVAPSKKIGPAKLNAAKAKAKRTGNTTLAKRVQFALNMNKV